MPAISGKMGTIYACNLGHDRDYMCLQSWFKGRPNMPASIIAPPPYRLSSRTGMGASKV